MQWEKLTMEYLQFHRATLMDTRQQERRYGTEQMLDTHTVELRRPEVGAGCYLLDPEWDHTV